MPNHLACTGKNQLAVYPNAFRVKDLPQSQLKDSARGNPLGMSVKTSALQKPKSFIGHVWNIFYMAGCMSGLCFCYVEIMQQSVLYVEKSPCFRPKKQTESYELWDPLPV